MLIGWDLSLVDQSTAQVRLHLPEPDVQLDLLLPSYPWLDRVKGKANLHRACVYLFYHEGLGMREIAKLLRVSPSRVHAHLHDLHARDRCQLCATASILTSWKPHYVVRRESADGL